MEQLIFEAIKKVLTEDKKRWHAGIGIFDDMIEDSDILKMAVDAKPGTFKLGKVHAVFNFLRITKAVEFKKINNNTFYKWTEKLEEMV